MIDPRDVGGESTMSKVSPWHSVKPNTPLVHHNETQCKTGNNIERENRREGTGGRQLCKECSDYK
jgi:hypothetical protein